MDEAEEDVLFSYAVSQRALAKSLLEQPDGAAQQRGKEEDGGGKHIFPNERAVIRLLVGAVLSPSSTASGRSVNATSSARVHWRSWRGAKKSRLLCGSLLSGRRLERVLASGATRRLHTEATYTLDRTHTRFRTPEVTSACWLSSKEPNYCEMCCIAEDQI